MKKQTIKKRITWGFCPITRQVQSKKIYQRTHFKNKTRDELT